MRVLVIDDDADFRTLALRWFRSYGIEAEGAANGAEGLALQRAWPADVVVTDIFMPEMEGIETIHDLGREFPEVKLIAMSGRDSRMKFDVLEVARQIGAVRTFKKPFKFEELIAAVRELTGPMRPHWRGPVARMAKLQNGEENDRRHSAQVIVVNGRFRLSHKGGEPPRDEPEPVTTTNGTTWTRQPKRVLVVEDNLDSVHALALLLRDIGHIVDYAIDGHVALDAARRFKPHFVLLDLGLPGLDGFEVARQMKRDPELQATRVVALTAFGQESYRKRAAAAGIEVYLVKPVATQTLQDLLG
jgi:CheY-like chemotaxis protein